MEAKRYIETACVKAMFSRIAFRKSAFPMIYLDHAATTPILPEARAAIAQGMDEWHNPSSQHGAGRRARAALESARERVAKALDWDGEVIFTSGATEALAIGWNHSQTLRRYASSVEHAALARLAQNTLPVDANGLLDPATIPPADLIAIQQVNNETGVIQPCATIGPAIAAKGAIWLCDAAQGAGKIALPPADMIVISGHKFGAPPGVGALLTRSLGLLAPTGGQERGYRPGTENLPYILGLAAALEAPRDWLEQAAALRAWFETEINAQIIAQSAPRIPTIGAYRLPGRNATQVLIRADMARIAISAGAACSSGSLKPSPVMAAMGLDETAAREVFRVSIGRDTTRTDLEALLKALA
jgi:cysteine desulfurase